MTRASTFLLLSAAVLTAPSAYANESGLLVLREAVSFSPEQRGSLAALFRVEFEKYGIQIGQVIEAPNVKQALEAGVAAERVFVLDVIRLDAKLVLGLAEAAPESGAPIFSERLTATGLDEVDLVAPRLIRAVLTRKKMEETQAVDNLTRKESRRWGKKHGEFFWGFGLPFAWTFSPLSDMGYGFNAKMIYEMEHLRLDFYLGGAGTADGGTDMGVFVTDLSVNYLFLKTNFSPYVGGGVGFGFVGIDEHGDSGFDGADGGPVLTLNAGAELFRLYSTRLLLGVRGVFPIFQIEDSGRDDRWIPVFLTEVSFVW